MKYKFIFILLSLALLITGCNQSHPTSANSVRYYYVNHEVEFGTESGIIVPTVREIEGRSDDYFYLVSQYLNGPTSYDCISPFPAGTALEELNWDQNRVQIVLSPQITTLSGLDLMVACACLTKTVAELTGINTVQMRSSGGLLNGEQTITLTSDSFMLWDQSTPRNSSN